LQYKVKDMSQADFGRLEIEMAEAEMPGLMACRTEFGAKQPFKGARPHEQYPQRCREICCVAGLLMLFSALTISLKHLWPCSGLHSDATTCFPRPTHPTGHTRASVPLPLQAR
jgi:adenosylhomocysteinase